MDSKYLFLMRNIGPGERRFLKGIGHWNCENIISSNYDEEWYHNDWRWSQFEDHMFVKLDVMLRSDLRTSANKDQVVDTYIWYYNKIMELWKKYVMTPGHNKTWCDENVGVMNDPIDYAEFVGDAFDNQGFDENIKTKIENALRDEFTIMVEYGVYEYPALFPDKWWREDHGVEYKHLRLYEDADSDGCFELSDESDECHEMAEWDVLCKRHYN